MHASDSFKHLIRIIESKPLNRNIKTQMTAIVEWLIGQALAGPPYRRPEIERKNWKALCSVARGTGIIEDFRARGADAFPALDFVDEAPPAPPVIKRNPLATMKLSDFFGYELVARVRESKAPESERRAITAALRYLALEAERPLLLRYYNWIDSTWAWVNPEIKRLGIWEKYKVPDAAQIKAELERFLRGRRKG